MSDLPRLLIIGNSHIAAPRRAYVAQPERWPDWDVDFVGLLAGDIAGLELRDGVLCPLSEEIAEKMRRFNMVTKVRAIDYDALAIVGGYSFSSTASFIADHRSIDFPSVQAGDQSCQLVGAGFLDAMLDQRLQGAAAGRMLTQLATLQKPIVMAPEPLPSFECSADPGKYGNYLRMVARQDHLHWRSHYEAAKRRNFGDRAVVLPWPETALQIGAFTLPDYMRGSWRLDVEVEQPHDESDFAHANPDYGALVLDQLMVALASL